MVSALRRLVACLTLLLPFEAMASETRSRQPAGEVAQASPKGDCGKHCVAAPAQQSSWQEVLQQFGLLLPKIPQMPSACRPVRQYRTYSQDRMPRQPCFYA